MACCQHRPEEGCFLVACRIDLGGGKSGCKCRAEVETPAETEVGQARVPDSAREAS